MFRQTLYVPMEDVTYPQDDEACFATKTTRCEFVRGNGDVSTVEIKRVEDDDVAFGKKRKLEHPGRGTLTYCELKSTIAELWQLNATFSSENERLHSLTQNLHAELRRRNKEYEEELSRLRALLKDIIDSKI